MRHRLATLLRTIAAWLSPPQPIAVSYHITVQEPTHGEQLADAIERHFHEMQRRDVMNG